MSNMYRLLKSVELQSDLKQRPKSSVKTQSLFVQFIESIMNANVISIVLKEIVPSKKNDNVIVDHDKRFGDIIGTH